MNYTHNDKIDTIIQELEAGKVYLDECIAVMKKFKYEDMGKKMSVWQAHLLLDKVHYVYRMFKRLPVINLLDLREANEK